MGVYTKPFCLRKLIEGNLVLKPLDVVENLPPLRPFLRGVISDSTFPRAILAAFTIELEKALCVLA